jgi:hypothetical protein
MLSSEEQQQRAGAARLERLASLGLGPLLEVDTVGRALLRPELHGLRELCRLRQVCRRARELVQLPCLIVHGGDASGQTFDPLPRNHRVYCLDLGRLAWSEALRLPHPLRDASMLGLPDGGLVVAGGHSVGTYGCVEAEDQHMSGMPYGLALDMPMRSGPSSPRELGSSSGSRVPGDAEYEPKMVGKPCSVITEDVWRAGHDPSGRAGWTALPPLAAVPVRGEECRETAPALATVRGRSRVASCTLNDGRLLVTGGRVCYPASGEMFPTHHTRHTSSVVAFDFRAGGPWKVLAPMHRCRCEHQIGVLPGGHVIVVGGEEEERGVEWPPAIEVTAEVYDPSTDSWSFVSGPSWRGAGETTMPREYFGFAGCVSADGMFTISGGSMYTGGLEFEALQELRHKASDGCEEVEAKLDEAESRSNMATVQCYDPATDSWSHELLPDMLEARCETKLLFSPFVKCFCQDTLRTPVWEPEKRARCLGPATFWGAQDGILSCMMTPEKRRVTC